MKFLLAILAVGVLTSQAQADQVCLNVSKNLIATDMIANPDGSVSVIYPRIQVGDRGASVLDTGTGGAGVCALMGKELLSEKSDKVYPMATVQLSAIGVVEDFDALTGAFARQVISLAVCK